METSSFAAIPSDKDGCMVVLSQLDLMLAKSELLESTWYSFASPAIDYVSEIWDSYTFLVEKLSEKAQKTFPGLFGVLTRDAASVGKSGIIATLGMTCKTHKEAGEVVPRLIHACRRSPFKPACRYVASLLRPHLAKEHIMKDSKHLVEHLENHRIPANHVLMKIDIKDFLCLVNTAYCATLSPSTSRALVHDLFGQWLCSCWDTSL